MIDAADPEKLIFQKALLLAFDKKKVIIKTKSYKGSRIWANNEFTNSVQERMSRPKRRIRGDRG